jgi:hypothetical protein
MHLYVLAAMVLVGLLGFVKSFRDVKNSKNLVDKVSTAGDKPMVKSALSSRDNQYMLVSLVLLAGALAVLYLDRKHHSSL